MLHHLKSRKTLLENSPAFLCIFYKSCGRLKSLKFPRNRYTLLYPRGNKRPPTFGFDHRRHMPFAKQSPNPRKLVRSRSKNTAGDRGSYWCSSSRHNIQPTL